MSRANEFDKGKWYPASPDNPLPDDDQRCVFDLGGSFVIGFCKFDEETWSERAPDDSSNEDDYLFWEEEESGLRWELEDVERFLILPD